MDEKLEKILKTYLVDYHNQRLNCAESVLITMRDYYGWDAALCPRVATAFGGGGCGAQGMCGTLSAALMTVGILYGRELGGDKTPAYEKGRSFIQWFESLNGTTLCRQITGLDTSTSEGQALFRAPGGVHERVCEPLVAQVCRRLVQIL